MNAPANCVFSPVQADENRPVDLTLYHEVCQFYYREARLQNARQPREWLQTLVDPDVHYWLPILEDRFARDQRPPPTPDEPAVYNDGYKELENRIARLETGLVWMEDPPSRVRFLVNNVEAYHTAEPDLIAAYGNVHVYRSRRQRDETHHFYGREDVLRRGADGRLRLLRRKIVLDQRVVLDKNLYMFL
jgi:3-phenylpropionate/cinnamic acid dioxygenase small subunit